MESEAKERLAKATDTQVRAILAALEVPDAVLLALLEHEERNGRSTATGSAPEPAPAKQPAPAPATVPVGRLGFSRVPKV